MDETVLTIPNDGRYTISVPPPPIGYWQISGPLGIQVCVSRRPRWLTRKMVAWLLEWEWRDGSPAPGRP
jgi:hypothetical protein